jgi:hypothetical protein
MEVGQTVFIQPTDSRYGKELKEVKITKVGRKYFETEYYGRYTIDGLRHDAGGYSPRYYVYLSKQEFEDKNELARLNDAIRKALGYTGVGDLSKAREIARILNVGDSKQ